jgi:AraC-like DNA-binding protein
LGKIEKYHLHKDDYSKLHFEINDVDAYFERNQVRASKPHRHSFYQLIWFKKAGKHYIDYNVIHHPANSLFFINKNQIHYFCSNSANEGYLYHFNDFFIERFNPQLMDRFHISIFNEIGDCFVKFGEPEAEKLKAISSFIEAEMKTKEYLYKEQVFSLFQTILFVVERANSKKGIAEYENDVDFALAVRFSNLVTKNIKEFLGIEKYAAQLLTNPKKLSASCKKHLMDTPASIIKQKKVLEAKRMLANQKVAIKEIAYSLGFEDPTYFTKYFKKSTGLTPKDFQNTILQ